MHSTNYPQSFPNSDETAFLHLVLCPDEAFPELFRAWSETIVLDDVDYATTRLLPLLYLRMQKAGIKGPLFGRINGVYRLAWVKNQRLLDVLAKVVALLEAEGLDVLLLKGVPLLLEAYGDVGARFLGDADVLIHPRHAKRASELMLASGWKMHNGSFPGLPHVSSETMQAIAKEATFVSDQKIEIDVHWHLFDPRRIERKAEGMTFEELWPRSIAVAWKGREYRAMSPEDMLLHIMAHGAAGNLHRTLRWVTDAVAIIRTYDIDWQRLVACTERYDLGIDVRTAFSYLLDQGFVELDEAVRAQILALTGSALAAQRYRDISSSTVELRPFGTLPELWSACWHNDARGVFPVRAYRSVGYLCVIWGVGSKRRLPKFIFDKYRRRLAHLLERFT